MFSRLLLYFYTLRQLKFSQLWYRIPLFNRIGRYVYSGKLNYSKAAKVNHWTPSIPSQAFFSAPATFTFLHKTLDFKNEIDWNNESLGLLWNYNLNYFEFLEQPDVNDVRGYQLIDQFINNYENLKAARSPYPISLRLIFWIRFFIRQNKEPERKYLQLLQRQARELQLKLEYQLLGNHLLENAFALFFTGAYLADEPMVSHAQMLLHKQLEEQILQDGGHFELSPMYHQLMLYRLLDVINIARACASHQSKTLLSYLESIAGLMLGWMQQMCFADGRFPLFNDAANGIAPTPVEIRNYADRLRVKAVTLPLSESGYRKWQGRKWEMFMDVGNPGPVYQPGHAHCDVLNFVLNVDNKPVLVDTGTSVYGGCPELRYKERSTASHNTVQIGEKEQSEIWGDFRMARKTKVDIIDDKKDSLKASHNGFYFKNSLHSRHFTRTESMISILDEVKVIQENCFARFHFHPDIKLDKLSEESYSFGIGKISFDAGCTIRTFDYEYAAYFGKRKSAIGLEVNFKGNLLTEIALE